MIKLKPTLRCRRHAAGFTMTELMVTVSVVAALLAVAAPSLSEMVAKQRLRSAASDLYLAMVKARAEAIKRNSSVTLAPASSNWLLGWSIADPGGGTALDVQGALSGVTVDSGVSQVVYGGNGRATVTTSDATKPWVTFGSSSSTAVRCVSVNAAGRPYMADTATC